MSSYCQCGHVLGEHYEGDPEIETDGGCLGDNGTCECHGFDELSQFQYAMIERGFD